jgi:putative ABC transport system permease protein
VSILGRKGLRDLRRQWPQFAAVALTVALGVAGFVAARGAYLDLQGSTDRIYADLRLADVTVSGPGAAAVAEDASLPGRPLATVRLQSDAALRIGDHPLLARVVSVPGAVQPTVDRLDIREGRMDGSGALVEQHLADHFGLHPGSAVAVLGPHGWQDLPVAAVVVSPEYLWPARSRQEIISDPGQFGVVFLPEPRMRTLAATSAVPHAALYAQDRAEANALVTAVRNLAGEKGGLEITARSEQPSFTALAQDIDAMAEYAVLFPLMFLTGAVLGVYILLSRLIRAQRTVIGTLLASGVAGRRLSRHYLGHGLVTGTLGSTAGALIGIPLGGWFVGEYGRALGLPYSLTTIHPDLIAEGLVAGVLAAGIATWAPARAAARTSPASAMRASAPSGPGRRSLLEAVLPPLRRLPARWRMMLRGLGRSRRRSAFTIAGVVLAVALVMVPVGMRDTIAVLVPRQFHDVQREDAQLYAAPGAAAQVLGAARVDVGVAAAEPISRQDVTIRTSRGHLDTLLYAFQPDTVMHGFPGGLPARGILLPVSLRDQLNVGPGAGVAVDLPAVGATISARVAGFVEEPMGAVAYTSLDQLAEWTGVSRPVAAANGVAVRLAGTADREAAVRRLTALPGVAAVLDTRSLESSISGAFGLCDTLVLLMGAIGAAMAAALLFNTASASLSERTVELGSLQAAYPIPWLLAEDTPAVRAAALPRLLDRPADDPDVVRARAAAMHADPITAILDAQDPAGWWGRPGPGYAPKYTGTVWQVIFLDQLGADPADARIRRACEYVLRWCPTVAGGLGASLDPREALHRRRPSPTA